MATLYYMQRPRLLKGGFFFTKHETLLRLLNHGF